MLKMIDIITEFFRNLVYAGLSFADIQSSLDSLTRSIMTIVQALNAQNKAIVELQEEVMKKKMLLN